MALIIYFICALCLSGITMLVRKKAVIRACLLLFPGVQTLLNVYAFFHLGQTELTYFRYDHAGLIFLTVLTILSYTTVYYSLIYLKQHRDNLFRQAIYATALILLIVSMSCVYIAEHAGLLWVFIEATTLCVSMLIYHERNALSIEATWKYVFICSVGVTFAFMGIIFLGMTVQKNGLYDLNFSAVVNHVATANPFWLKMVFLFILVGFSTKMGLFPMQTITVDAHTVAPFPVSAFISTTLMNVGFVGIYRFYTALEHTSIGGWMSHLLMWSGILSVLVAAVYMLTATHLKRLSAYSSLEHMGLAAIGLSVGGPVLYAVFLHLILHAFTKAGLFYHLGGIHARFQTYKIESIKNYFGRSPSGGLIFFILLLFLGAVPPSGLFVTEFLILKGMFQTGHIWEMCLLILLMTVVLFAFIKNGLKMVFSGDKAEIPSQKNYFTSELIPQLILLAAVVWLGFFPPMAVVDFINQCFM